MTKLLEASNLEILETQMNSAKFVMESLGMCCNLMMQCREEAHREAKKIYKLAKFQWLEEKVRCLLLEKETEIWFDLDGITFDWRAELLREYPQFENIDVFNKAEDRDLFIEDLYRRRPNFFLELPHMEEAATRIERALLAGYPVKFLTATGEWGDPMLNSRNKGIALQRYLAKHLSPEAYQIFVDTGGILENVIIVRHSVDKAKYIRSNRILVDDYLKNVSEWIQGGGTSIQVDTEGLEEAEAWKLYDRLTDGKLRHSDYRHSGGF